MLHLCVARGTGPPVTNIVVLFPEKGENFPPGVSARPFFPRPQSPAFAPVMPVQQCCILRFSWCEASFNGKTSELEWWHEWKRGESLHPFESDDPLQFHGSPHPVLLQVLLGISRGLGSGLLDIGVWMPSRPVKKAGGAEAIPPGYGTRLTKFIFSPIAPHTRIVVSFPPHASSLLAYSYHVLQSTPLGNAANVNYSTRGVPIFFCVRKDVRTPVNCLARCLSSLNL